MRHATTLLVLVAIAAGACKPKSAATTKNLEELAQMAGQTHYECEGPTAPGLVARFLPDDAFAREKSAEPAPAALVAAARQAASAVPAPLLQHFADHGGRIVFADDIQGTCAALEANGDEKLLKFYQKRRRPSCTLMDNQAASTGFPFLTYTMYLAAEPAAVRHDLLRSMMTIFAEGVATRPDLRVNEAGDAYRSEDPVYGSFRKALTGAFLRDLAVNPKLSLAAVDGMIGAGAVVDVKAQIILDQRAGIESNLGDMMSYLRVPAAKRVLTAGLVDSFQSFVAIDAFDQYYCRGDQLAPNSRAAMRTLFPRTFAAFAKFGPRLLAAFLRPVKADAGLALADWFPNSNGSQQRAQIKRQLADTYDARKRVYEDELTRAQGQIQTLGVDLGNAQFNADTAALPGKIAAYNGGKNAELQRNFQSATDDNLNLRRQAQYAQQDADLWRTNPQAAADAEVSRINNRRLLKPANPLLMRDAEDQETLRRLTGASPDAIKAFGEERAQRSDELVQIADKARLSSANFYADQHDKTTAEWDTTAARLLAESMVRDGGTGDTGRTPEAVLADARKVYVPKEVLPPDEDFKKYIEGQKRTRETTAMEEKLGMAGASMMPNPYIQGAARVSGAVTELYEGVANDTLFANETGSFLKSNVVGAAISAATGSPAGLVRGGKILVKGAEASDKVAQSSRGMRALIATKEISDGTAGTYALGHLAVSSPKLAKTGVDYIERQLRDKTPNFDQLSPQEQAVMVQAERRKQALDDELKAKLEPALKRIEADPAMKKDLADACRERFKLKLADDEGGGEEASPDECAGVAKKLTKELNAEAPAEPGEQPDPAQTPADPESQPADTTAPAEAQQTDTTEAPETQEPTTDAAATTEPGPDTTSPQEAPPTTTEAPEPGND